MSIGLDRWWPPYLGPRATGIVWLGPIYSA